MPVEERSRKFLKRLQEAAYNRLGLTPAIYDRDWLAKLRAANWDQTFHQIFGSEPEDKKERLFRGWNRTASQITLREEGQATRTISDDLIANIPTPYENPFNYAIISRLQREIENAIKAHSGEDYRLAQSIIPRITVGTLPSGEVNARAIAVPSGENYLVVFDSQIFNFANLLSKAVARAMPVKDFGGRASASMRPDDVQEEIRRDPDVGERFLDVIVMYLVLGTPQGAAPYTLEDRYRTMADLLRDGMELFIVAHEYGHIVRGHLSKATPLREASIGGVPVSTYYTGWNKEFEADSFAVQIASPALQLRGYHQLQSYIGADFFFACAMLIERGLNILNTGCDTPAGLDGSEPESLHPPAGMRMAMIERAMTRGFPQQHLSAVLTVKNMLLQVIEILWREIAVPKLLDLHNRGIRPSKMWVEIARRHGAAS